MIQKIIKSLSLVVMIIISVNITSCAKTTSELQAKDGDYVVLFHGIRRSSSHMEGLQEYLEKLGYHVINVDYQSTVHEVDVLATMMNAKLSKQIPEDKTVHYVGYSMGGVLIRVMMNQVKPKNLGRVVQLAPPNHGSEVADFLKDIWLFKKIYGPAGQQLATNQQQVQNLLGSVTYELGVIAGNRSIDPISSNIIPGDDDGKVSVESTKVSGMKQHIIVPATHEFFPSNKHVREQTAIFLKTGAFSYQ